MMVGAGLANQMKMVKMLLGERFHQMNPIMEEFLAMDDPSLADALIEIAENVDLTDTIAWIEEHFYNRSRSNNTSQGEGPRKKAPMLKESRRHTVLQRDYGAWYNSIASTPND